MKEQLEMATQGIFNFAKFVMGYLCVRPYILFIIHILLCFLSYVNITKLFKFKIVCSQKLIRSLADTAEYIRQIKRSDGIFSLKSGL